MKLVKSAACRFMGGLIFGYYVGSAAYPNMSLELGYVQGLVLKIRFGTEGG